MVVGILAHVDAGKTTLSEALLYQTGQIRSLGRVDHQDAFLDTDQMERSRGITIFSKQARLQDDGVDITLLDTPGHVDFSAEMERTLQVLDYAILVVSGTDGVQGHTRTLWRLLQHYEVPTFLFVNKMDLPGADEGKIAEELKRELSGQIVPMGKAIEDLSQEEQENLAVCDETLMDAYMETGSIDGELLAEAIAKRNVFPCFFGSALKLEGTEALLRGLRELTMEGLYPSDFSARVYKIGRDDKGARLTFLKVTGGSLSARDKIEYLQKGSEDLLTEKVDQLRLYSGEKYETCDHVEAGEVVAVTGLSMTYPGQGLGAASADNLPILEPVLNYRMILPEGVNPAEFWKKLQILQEEDPQLFLVWDEEHKEIHVQLMGQVQMEVLSGQILSRFGVAVVFGPGSIVYKETIAKPVEGIGHFEPLRHYAEVHLLLQPGEPGSGISVDSVCSEDILDKNWQRLIATHIEEREHRGVLTGSGLVDVKCTILTGRASAKHTVGGDFRQATYRAIRQGLKAGESVLLEPYYQFSLLVLTENVGRAMTDLEQRHAKMEGPEYVTGAGIELARITGRAPVSTMQDYVSEVHAYTKGQGSLTLELAGYDVCHNPEEVIRARGYDSEQDLRNPTGSVFCAQGSGFLVPWDEVDNYMHLPRVFQGDTSEEALKASADGFAYDTEGKSFGATAPGRASWAKSVASMSESELDAELADVYAREFGGSAQEDDSRKRWGQRTEKKPAAPHEKLDKKGNPIYPKVKQSEEVLIVDGYNIIFAWEDLKELSRVNIDSARDALCDRMSSFQGFRRGRLILVFDAYKVKGNAGKKMTYQNIEVVYTREDETADAFIERTVHDIADTYKVTVATNDGLEQQTILSLGGLRMSARELREDMERATRAGLEEFRRTNRT